MRADSISVLGTWGPHSLPYLFSQNEYGQLLIISMFFRDNFTKEALLLLLFPQILSIEALSYIVSILIVKRYIQGFEYSDG